MADGRRVPIESLVPGDVVASLSVPGLKIDTSFRAQYEWLSTWGLDGAVVRDGRVASVKLGEHDGFYLLNRRIKATFEHPFLVRRDEEWGFCSAENLRVGDHLITLTDGEVDEERLAAVEHIPGRVRTVSIHIPGLNTFLADGVWTHNDTFGNSSSSGGHSSGSTLGGQSSVDPSLSGSSSSGTVLSSSASGSSKSSGSSFSASASSSLGGSSGSSGGK